MGSRVVIAVLLALGCVYCGARSPLDDDHTIVVVNRGGGGRDAGGALAVDAGVDSAPIADASPDRSPPADSGALAAGAPRPIAPLSTATATSQTPRFRWALPSDADGAEVEIFRDRACTIPVTTFVAMGTSGAPASPLARGTYFWRLRGTSHGQVGSTSSAVWQLYVGARSAPVDSSWGTVLDVNGDGFADIAIGAYTSNGYAGTVEVFLGGAHGLSTASALLRAPDGSVGSYGYSVASAGDVNGDGFADLAVGAPGAGTNGGGAVFVYFGGPNGLAMIPKTIESSLNHAGSFGDSIASAGDVNGDGYADVIVGTGNTDSSIYVSLGGASGMGAPIAIDRGFYYGAVAGAGDVNGDGFGDVIAAGVAMPNAAGTAKVYLGSASGLATHAIALVGPGLPPDGTWHASSYGAVASADDVNGDGYADVLVGGSGVNRAYVYLGGANGPSPTPTTLVGPADIHGQFGASVGGARDVNGDGFADAIVGAWAANQPAGNGAAYVFLGSASGLSTTPIPLVNPNGLGDIRDAGVAYDMFGIAVNGAGDVDGDGFADVVVGAYDVNRAYVYLGGASGPSPSPVILKGEAGRFGGSVARPIAR